MQKMENGLNDAEAFEFLDIWSGPRNTKSCNSCEYRAMGLCRDHCIYEEVKHPASYVQ